jgi:hypothetical protein
VNLVFSGWCFRPKASSEVVFVSIKYRKPLPGWLVLVFVGSSGF